ncbi:MAG: universal stress protein, partial [Bdellovibrionales bacterium]|nr:universal stress protein [Massilia sp.]
MFKHILFPTDGSASSDIAAQSAMRFAKSIGAKITALHVLPAISP